MGFIIDSYGFTGIKYVENLQVFLQAEDAQEELTTTFEGNDSGVCHSRNSRHGINVYFYIYVDIYIYYSWYKHQDALAATIPKTFVWNNQHMSQLPSTVGDPMLSQTTPLISGQSFFLWFAMELQQSIPWKIPRLKGRNSKLKRGKYWGCIHPMKRFCKHGSTFFF